MVAIVESYLAHRLLIQRLVKRELEARYRGSVLGMAWSFITPLLMLAVFTFVFSVIFQVRWNTQVQSQGWFALVMFCGLIVYQFFADCLNRAPTLLLENVSYIKKVVFPLEASAWVAIGVALLNAGISFAMLMVGYLALVGLPPWTALLLPLVLAPLLLFTAGAVWVLSSVGVFLRDLRQLVGLLTTLLMFLSPIFYPMEAVPERFRVFIQLNPLAVVIEQTRGVLLLGQPPDWLVLALYTLAAWGVAWFGLWWFNKVRKGFADVV